jgi:hypothetical protein
VDVAPDRDHDFLLVEGLGRLHALARLADVELLVHGRAGMDVVERLVVVLDLEGLADLQHHHVRLVHAALLVELDRFRRARIGAGEAALDVHEDVLEAAVLDVDGLALEAVLVLLLAVGSAETLIFSGAGAVPAKLILPAIDADPLAAPASAARGRRLSWLAGAAAGASCFSPPPQATRARGAARRDNGEDFRMDIT